MKLDAIRRNTGLTVEKIEEADADQTNRDIRGLKARRHRVLCVEFLPRALNLRGEQTAGTHASGIRDLGDHGIAGRVLNDKVVVRVGFELVLSQRGVDLKCGRFGWQYAVAGR